MSYRLLKIFSLSSVCIFSLGCTSTSLSPTAIVTPIEVSEWETRLPVGQGSVKITFTLPQQAKAEFQFFDGKPSRINAPLARIILSDKNCTSGHLGSIDYKKSNSEYFMQYFEKEAPWNSINTITLDWNSDNQIITKLNNELLRTDIYKHANTLKIVSNSAPIKIQTFEYLPR